MKLQSGDLKKIFVTFGLFVTSAAFAQENKTPAPAAPTDSIATVTPKPKLDLPGRNFKFSIPPDEMLKEHKQPLAQEKAFNPQQIREEVFKDTINRSPKYEEVIKEMNKPTSPFNIQTTKKDTLKKAEKKHKKAPSKKK